MLLTLTYNELAKLIENRSGKVVKFDFVDSSTIKITVPVKLMLAQINPEINIKIVKIKGVLLTIEYTGNHFVNFLSKIALNRIIANQSEPRLLGNRKSRLITINMGLIPKLCDILPIVNLTTIYFTPENVIVEGNVVEKEQGQGV